MKCSKLVCIMEKAMAPHSSPLAWKIPWMEEPGRLQSMESRRVWHDWETSLSLFTFMHWRRKWQPTPVFLPGESQGGGAWWAAVYGVTQSQTWLKWLSSLAAASRKIDLWKYSYLDNLWKSSLYLQDNACRHPCLLVTPHLARWLETRKVCWIPPRGSP